MPAASRRMGVGMGFLYILSKERMKLTSIKLSLTGAHAWAAVSGPLTSGMVGIPVTIEYDDAWEGLIKNLMCRCSPWGSNDGEIRTLLNVGETSTVAHEVMQQDMYLYLGVEGFRNDGTLVIPTTWARCGKIEYGANTCEDPSTEPELPIWNQLQTEMEQIRQDVVTPELVTEIKGYAQSAGQAAVTAERSAQNAAAASHLAVSNANSAEVFVKQAQTYSEAAKGSASSAANLANGALQAQRAAEAAAQRAEAAANSSQGANLLDVQTILRNMMAIIREQVECKSGTPQAYRSDISSLAEQCDALITGLTDSDSSDTTEKTLTGISATYTGGSVPVGTAVTALTGIVVTAYYSDGSSAAVTDYTLSGTIAEGENTVTVSYGGKTATITVIGATESGGNDVYTPELLWEAGYRIDTNSGAVVEADGWSVSQLIDISGYSSLRVATTSTTWFNANVMAGTDEYPHTALQHNTSYWGGSYMTDETFDVLAYSYLRIASSTNHAASFTVELK